MKKTKKQAGFTIIELVVVIALLGILAATALPRFMDVTEDAHVAAVNGFYGALGSSVALVRSQAVAKNAQSTNMTYDTATVTVGATGYPTADGATAPADCSTLITEIMQSSSALADYTVTAPANVCTYTYTDNTAYIVTYTPATGVVAKSGF